MKKRLIIALSVGLLLMLLFTVSAFLLPHGKVSDVQITIDPQASLSEEDIRDAMQLVKREFRRGWPHCTLTELYYEEEYNRKYAAANAEQYGADEAVILRSTFTVGPWYNGGNLAPGDVRTKWSWILTRSGKGGWELQTWGYG